MTKTEKGKRLFFGMAIIVLAISLITSIYSSFVGGSSGLISGLIRTGAEGALIYFIFKGKKWAKIVMIVLLSLGIIVAIAGLMISVNILFIIFLASYIGSVYVIAFSPSVKEYLKSIN